jgi:septal ring factor EnvC (AmiA/AmiB activator)
VVAAAVGLNAFLGTDLRGSASIETELGTTSVDAARIRSLRLVDGAENQFCINSEDGSSVTGKLIAADLTVQLLCNNTRVPIQGPQIKAIEVAPSPAALEKADKLNQLRETLAKTEAEITRLQNVLADIEAENRTLAQQRDKRQREIRDKNREIIRENKKRRRNYTGPGRAPEGKPLLEVKDDQDVQRLNAELAANSRKVAETKKAILASKKEILKIKKQIEDSSATPQEP